MDRINGSAIMFKSSDKYYAGVTDIDYSASAQVSETLIKEDGGKPQKTIDRIDRKVSLSGIVCVNAAGDETSHIDMQGIRAVFEGKVKVPFVYGMFTTGKPEITGNMLITSYSEKSGSSDKATWSAEAEIVDDADLVVDGVTA